MSSGLGDLRPIALSLGDPAGIGPEIAVKAWRALRAERRPFFVVGDYAALAAVSPEGAAEIARIDAPAEAAAVFPRALPVYDMPLERRVVAGQPSAAHGPAVICWIERAASFAMSGEAAALVTAPIAKAPLYEAGFGFAGHTEFLGALTSQTPMDGPRGPIMMLAAADLRAVPVTIHEPLSQVPHLLTTELIVQAGEVTASSLKTDFGITQPRLALGGLNPHAGESGTIGREEIDIIGPAARLLRAKGIDCTDPKPADSLFHPEARATYDAALCMTHDQALIPVKMLDFWGGVNLTLGLPLVRTSPDHGVGYDIAGKGVARPDSLIAAIRMAAEIADRRAA